MTRLERAYAQWRSDRCFPHEMSVLRLILKYAFTQADVLAVFNDALWRCSALKWAWLQSFAIAWSHQPRCTELPLSAQHAELVANAGVLLFYERCWRYTYSAPERCEVSPCIVLALNTWARSFSPELGTGAYGFETDTEIHSQT